MGKFFVILAYSLGLLASASAHTKAQSPLARSALFDGATHIKRVISDGGAGNRASGIITYWYAASQKQTGTILASYPNLSLPLLAIQVQHYKLNATTMVLLFSAYDSTGSLNLLAQGVDALPYDSLWHSIQLTWDSDLFLVQYTIDGTTKGLTVTHSGGAFLSPINGNQWFIGADRSGLMGATTDFFIGPLAEMYVHLQDNDYIYLTTPGLADVRPNALIRQGWATPRPLHMGENCEWMFGLVANSTAPTICQRGDHAQFLKNQWGDFTVGSGALLDGVTSPWDIFP